MLPDRIDDFNRAPAPVAVDAMAMLAAKPVRTIDDFLKLPEGTQAELIEGEIFMQPCVHM